MTPWRVRVREMRESRRPGPVRGLAPFRPRVFTLGLMLALALASAGCGEPRGAGGWECIAPAAPGGGWDLTCRAVGRSLQELGLAPGLVRVVNIPGAGGGIAFAHVVAQRGGDEGVLVAASPATTLRLAQGQFAHLRETDVEWLAAVATDYGVVAVRPHSPWQDLHQLLEAWRADPAAFTVSGGSAVGGQDHMKILLLAREAGVDPRAVRYIPFDGGGEALNALLGGFVDVFSGDVTQVEGQMEAQGLRVLTVLAPERVSGVLAEVPTAREEGFPVDWVTWRGFYLPPGLSPEGRARWLDVMQSLESSEAWARERERSRLDPFFMAGEEFREFVLDQIVAFRELSRDLGLLPDPPGREVGSGGRDESGGLIPTAMGTRSAADPAGPGALPLAALLLILGGAGTSAYRRLRRGPLAGGRPSFASKRGSPSLEGLWATLLLLVYPAALHFMGFVVATTSVLWGMARLFRAAPMRGFVGAMCLTLGLHFLFQYLLGLPLPGGELWAPGSR